MTQTIDYALPRARRYSKALAWCASILVFYPLLPAALLYGEWLLAWFLLGHRPRHVVADEAGTIDGIRWLHTLASFALALSFPGAAAALLLNVLHAGLHRPKLVSVLARFAALLVLWLGLYALLRSDPGDVYTWWGID